MTNGRGERRLNLKIVGILDLLRFVTIATNHDSDAWMKMNNLTIEKSCSIQKISIET